jgi:hypothetical protein
MARKKRSTVSRSLNVGHHHEHVGLPKSKADAGWRLRESKASEIARLVMREKDEIARELKDEIRRARLLALRKKPAEE